MSKLARCCYIHALTSVVGFLFLISFGYDCFSPVQAFIESPLSRPCLSRRRGFDSAIALSEETDDGQQKSLLEFLSPMSSCKANQMSGTDLAYVGDAVFELFIRSRHVWPSKRTSDLQNTVVGIVRGTSFEDTILSVNCVVISTEDQNWKILIFAFLFSHISYSWTPVASFETA